MLAQQRYISKELTHFVGKSWGRILDNQYSLLVDILKSGRLIHDFGGTILISRNESLCNNKMYDPGVICFCDIPVEDMKVHIIKYSPFGISFLKSFLVEKGANPVFYNAKNSLANSTTRCKYFDDMMELRNKIGKAIEKLRTSNDSIALAEFKGDLQELDYFFGFLDFYVFSFIKFFDDAKSDEDPENYYMEREWRMRGNLIFGLENVHRIILPKSFAKRFREDIPNYFGQITFVD